MNFTHRKILFSIFFKPFIHFPGNKYLLDKEKIKTDSFQRPSRQNGPTQLPCTRAARTQVATWAWADKAVRPLAAAWAGLRSGRSRPLIYIGRLSGRFDGTKHRPTPLPQTLISFFTLCLSLFALSAPRRHRATASVESRAMASSPAPSSACALPNG